MKTLRVGFVGLGGICRTRHIPGLKKISGIELVGVCNRTRESSEAAARAFSIPCVYDSWNKLVCADDIDAVFVGTWPYLHKDISMAALDARKHVFCQARMAMNYAEALEMRDAALRSDRVAMLCPVPIGLTKDAAIRRLLHDGSLGDIHLIRVQSLADTFLESGTPINWRKDHRLSGLNMHTFGMYVEVVHRWFGWTASISAMAQTFVAKRQDGAGEWMEVQIPDQFMVNSILASGAPVQYVFSTAVSDGHDAIEIYGSKMTLRYEVGANMLLGAKRGEPMREIAVAPSEVYDLENWQVESDFVRAIREGAEYHPNFEDGLRYMQVLQAAYDADREQRVICIEPGD